MTLSLAGGLGGVPNPSPLDVDHDQEHRPGWKGQAIWAGTREGQDVAAGQAADVYPPRCRKPVDQTSQCWVIQTLEGSTPPGWWITVSLLYIEVEVPGGADSYS